MRTPDAGERNLWTFSKRHLFTVRGFITVEGPVTGEDIRRLAICSGLNQFRQPLQQQEALVEAACRKDWSIWLTFIIPLSVALPSQTTV